jgi:hypothetical protein
MIDRVRGMIRILPPIMSNIVKYAVLTGLRPSEACESVRLINSTTGDGHTTYYNSERQALEHFRFSDVFLRPTKKAYMSYIKPDNLRPIANLGSKTNHLERHSLGMQA